MNVTAASTLLVVCTDLYYRTDHNYCTASCSRPSAQWDAPEVMATVTVPSTGL